MEIRKINHRKFRQIFYCSCCLDFEAIEIPYPFRAQHTSTTCFRGFWPTKVGQKLSREYIYIYHHIPPVLFTLFVYWPKYKKKKRKRVWKKNGQKWETLGGGRLVRLYILWHTICIFYIVGVGLVGVSETLLRTSAWTRLDWKTRPEHFRPGREQ